VLPLALPLFLLPGLVPLPQVVLRLAAVPQALQPVLLALAPALGPMVF
jgi:hypothetical protein